MVDLTPAQKLMVEDGAPAELVSLTQEQRAAAWKGLRPKATKTFAPDKPAARDEDPATKALRKEIAAADERKKAERLARLKELKASRTQPAAQPRQQESTMKKTSTKARVQKGAKKALSARKAAKAAPAKKAVKARAAAQNARTPAAGKPDVVQQIADMMAAPGGASMAEMVKATKIEAHPMRSKIKLVRDRLGYTTTPPSKENGYRYSATPPKKAAE